MKASTPLNSLHRQSEDTETRHIFKTFVNSILEGLKDGF
jgi:hypothetical protein